MDNQFGMIRWKQQSLGLPDFGLSFNNPDFVKLAESFSVKGCLITKASDFKPTLIKYLNQKGVNLIELPIDYTENHQVFTKQLNGHSL